MVFVHVGILLLSVTGPAQNARDGLPVLCSSILQRARDGMGKKVGRSRGHPVMAAESPRFSPHLERDRQRSQHPYLVWLRLDGGPRYGRCRGV